jgi:hypothetical protein
MPACPPITFTGVTQEAWDCLKARALGVGVRIEGDSGSASMQGLTIEIHRDPRANTLTLNVDAPAGAPCDDIARRLREAVAVCGVS